MPDDPALDPARLMQAFLSSWNTGAAIPPQPVSSGNPAEHMLAQALAAANMPSRADVGEMAARLDLIEQSLARIEQALAPAVVPKRQRAKPANPA